MRSLVSREDAGSDCSVPDIVLFQILYWICVSKSSECVALCWVCFTAMMHSSSQSVQGTNLLQLPVSHRHQGFGAETISVDDYAIPTCKSDTAVLFELCCSGPCLFVAKAELEQSVKVKSTEKDSLSGISRQKVFVATTQPRGRLLMYVYSVLSRLNMDKGTTGLVLAGRA